MENILTTVVFGVLGAIIVTLLIVFNIKNKLIKTLKEKLKDANEIISFIHVDLVIAKKKLLDQEKRIDNHIEHINRLQEENSDLSVKLKEANQLIEDITLEKANIRKELTDAKTKLIVEEVVKPIANKLVYDKATLEPKEFVKEVIKEVEVIKPISMEVITRMTETIVLFMMMEKHNINSSEDLYIKNPTTRTEEMKPDLSEDYIAYFEFVTQILTDELLEVN